MQMPTGVRAAVAAVAAGALLLSGGAASAAPPDLTAAAGLLLVRAAGTAPITVDTTELIGPALRAWWYDRLGGTTVDAGSVPRGPEVTLYPPDTGDGTAHDWTLVVVDATRGLVPR